MQDPALCCINTVWGAAVHAKRCVCMWFSLWAFNACVLLDVRTTAVELPSGCYRMSWYCIGDFAPASCWGEEVFIVCSKQRACTLP